MTNEEAGILIALILVSGSTLTCGLIAVWKLRKLARPLD